ncbi:alanine acetyltransferase, putative [Babesia ovis]|uniref:Alanine acetyltransferase, putative n=1 Tax=Babesia ovis TaxID=5869 RepID=A0A9W5TBI2_BABOV|nr:alanine acetyltransferase, putative [Babesia ovis]
MTSVASLSQKLQNKLHVTPPDRQGLNVAANEKLPYHTLSNRACHIHALTKHTMRQAWILLNSSTEYNYDHYLEDGKVFPEVKPLMRYTAYSSLIYCYNFAVGLALCDTVKYDWTGQSTKGLLKPHSKAKPESLAVVILSISVLPNYRGIKLSERLLDHIIDKARSARVFKMFAVADPLSVSFYTGLGFKESINSPVELDQLHVTVGGSKPNLVVLEYTITNT